MTFRQIEETLPNGFHDAKIEHISLDYPAGALLMNMSILTGTPGESDQDEYGPAELKISGLYFCSMEPPDPTYPFNPNGKPLRVSGDSCGRGSLEISNLVRRLPPGASCYRFFVEQWNSFIYIAASDVQIAWSGATRSLESVATSRKPKQ
jgi:hypothetical protein